MIAEILNPFKKVSEQIYDVILGNRLVARNAEKRIDRLLKSYRDILQDSRYAPIKGELQEILREQILLLVDEASKCNKCCMRAERIRLIGEIVDHPQQFVLNIQSQMRSQDQAEGGGQ